MGGAGQDCLNVLHLRPAEVNLMRRHYLTQVIPMPSPRSVFTRMHAGTHVTTYLHSHSFWSTLNLIPVGGGVQTGNVFIYFAEVHIVRRLGTI